MDKTNGTQNDFEVLTPAAVAKMLGYEKRTLDNLRSLGKGPAYIKMNQRRIGYLYADVVEYIQKHRIEPANR